MLIRRWFRGCGEKAATTDREPRLALQTVFPRERCFHRFRKTSILFLNPYAGVTTMKTMKEQILNRIEHLGVGKAFMAKDFLDIASRGTIDMALSSLVREGAIRRVRRGLYDSPKMNQSLGGALSPDIDESARALASRHRWNIVAEGTWAANLLGLSTKVPAKIIYLSDGPSKNVLVGRRTIYFKHARPQALAGEEGKSVLVVQALGKEEVDKAVIARLRSVLSEADRRKLVRATRFGIDWIYETAKTIAEKPL